MKRSPIRPQKSPVEPVSDPERERNLGIFVRERRRGRGLSQAQVAEFAGVGIRAVSELERGKATLRMDVANAVLGVFGKALGVVDVVREDVTS